MWDEDDINNRINGVTGAVAIYDEIVTQQIRPTMKHVIRFQRCSLDGLIRDNIGVKIYRGLVEAMELGIDVYSPFANAAIPPRSLSEEETDTIFKLSATFKADRRRQGKATIGMFPANNVKEFMMSLRAVKAYADVLRVHAAKPVPGPQAGFDPSALGLV